MAYRWSQHLQMPRRIPWLMTWGNKCSNPLWKKSCIWRIRICGINFSARRCLCNWPTALVKRMQLRAKIIIARKNPCLVGLGSVVLNLETIKTPDRLPGATHPLHILLFNITPLISCTIFPCTKEFCREYLRINGRSYDCSEWGGRS